MQKQNDVFYIQEAFKKLQFLNEDSFNLQDVGVVDELTSFVADDKDAPWIEEIIDVESDFTDELQDSYVGKVILQCKCCNAKIYKDASEVFVSEEDGCANVEEECPLCGNAYGWSVIGKIEPYNEEEFKEEEPVKADLELDLTDDEINEALKKSISEDLDIHVQQDENGNVEEVIIEKEPEDNVVIDDESPKLPNDDIVVDESLNEEVGKEYYLKPGKHKLSGVDYIPGAVDTWGDGNEEDLGTLINIVLDGQVFSFVEDPQDGYRSSIADHDGNVSISEVKNKFPEVDVKIKNSISDTENITKIYDVKSNKLILEFGTEFEDAYYPYSVFNYYPENMAINESLNEEVDIKVDSAPEGKLTAEVEVDEGEHVEVVDKEEVELPAEDIEVVEEGCHDKLKESNLEDADTKAKTNSEIFKQALKRSALKQFNFGTNHAEDHDVYAELGDYLLIGFSPSGSCWYSSLDDDEKEFKSVKALINSLKKNGWPELFKDEIKEELKHNSLEDVNIDVEEASNDAQKLENPEEEPVKEELNEDLEVGKIYKSPNAGSYKFIDIIETKEGKLYKFKPLNTLAVKTSKEVAIDEPYAFDGEYSYMPRETVEYTFFDNIDESLNEDIENLSLDTESTHMEMTSDENGKVTVVTEPRKEVEEVVEVEDEMIAPLSDEEKVEIENNEEVVDEPIEDEFEIDEFEEETFNELGESFLKRVYENVNSFKTSSVAYKKGRLVVEGLIKFNSGKEKSTSFIFEKFKNTKRNKVVVTGLNETFSKSKSAFMLKGDLKNKRFVSESLIYNYSTHSLNESNKQEAVKVYGRAIVRNK